MTEWLIVEDIQTLLSKSLCRSVTQARGFESRPVLWDILKKGGVNMETKERPKSFVIAKYSDAIRLVFPDVVTLYYMIDRETKEEYVVTEYKSPVTSPSGKEYEVTHTFKICVSADSNAAMLEDVWRELKKRFN